MLVVDLLGSRNDVGASGREMRRDGGLAELSLLARLGRCIPSGTGVASDERGPESAALGELFALFLSGTMVVTPLTLLASEYARGLTIPVDAEPAVVERAVVREYRVGVSEGAALRGGGMLVAGRERELVVVGSEQHTATSMQSCVSFSLNGR